MRLAALCVSLTLIACDADLVPFGPDASTPLDGAATNAGSVDASGAGGRVGEPPRGSGGASEGVTPPEPHGTGAVASGAGGGPVTDAALPTEDANSIGPDACARTVYYLDQDRDGFGDEARVFVGCAPPTEGHWTAESGDCDDADPDVFPGQTAYFGVPHVTPGGVSNFDYDCSGDEQPDPAQPLAPTSCGLLALALCGGAGHAKTDRVGAGINAYCGSKVMTACQAAALGVLVCEAVSQPTEEPFRCR